MNATTNGTLMKELILMTLKCTATLPWKQVAYCTASLPWEPNFAIALVKSKRGHILLKLRLIHRKI